MRKLTGGNIGFSGTRAGTPDQGIAGVTAWRKAITALWVVRLAAAF